MRLKQIEESFDKGSRLDPLVTILSKKIYGWETTSDFFKTGREEIKEVIDYLGGLKINVSGKALDFGCGVGRLTQALGDYFRTATGVDISSEMIKLANEYNSNKEKCNFVHNNSPDLRKFRENTFDFIYSNITLQHMHPRYSKEYIREFFRILKPRGIVLFQIPSKRIKGSKEKWTMYIVKKLYYSIMPERLRDMYKIRYQRIPFEMHQVPKHDILNLIDECNASLLDVTEDKVAGERYESLRYCCEKRTLPRNRSESILGNVFN